MAEIVDAGQLKARLDMVEVIGGYVPLKKAGRSYRGLCPFHAEKTPSFHVIPEKGLYYCFGCKASGDVIDFVQRMEGLDFVEVGQRLARRIGCEFKTSGPSVRGSGKERLFAANRFAARFYARQLAQSPEAQVAREFLEARGIDQESCRAFLLGYAPSGWDALYRALREAKFAHEEAVTAGLAISRQSGQGAYDRFRHRLVFPILDTQGQVVGFGGRALGEEEPKYLNSPETPVFIKGRQLYGIHLALPAIREREEAMVVEGYTDVIACHSQGLTHAVATLGTALTGDQARWLARFARKVVLAYDADSAGIGAAVRNLDVLAETGLDLRISVLPEGHDPDSALRELGRATFLELMEGSTSLYHFAIDRIIEEARSVAGSDTVAPMRATVQFLRGLKSPTRQISLIAYGAEQLTRGDPGRVAVVEAALRHEVLGHGQQRRRTAFGAPVERSQEFVLQAVSRASTEAVPLGVIRAGRILLRAMVESPPEARRILSALPPADFALPAHRALAAAIEAMLAETGGVEPALVSDRVGDAARREWAQAVTDELDSQADETSVRACIRELADFKKLSRKRELEPQALEILQSGVRTPRDTEILTEYQGLVNYFQTKRGARVS